MKTFLKPAILSLTFLTLVFSCNPESEVAPKPNAQELSELIANQLNGVAIGLRENNQTFANERLVLSLGEQHLLRMYGEGSEAISKYHASFDNAKLRNARTNAQVNLSDEAKKYLDQIQESVNSSRHLKAFKETLTKIDRSIINSSVATN